MEADSFRFKIKINSFNGKYCSTIHLLRKPVTLYFITFEIQLLIFSLKCCNFQRRPKFLQCDKCQRTLISEAISMAECVNGEITIDLVIVKCR